MSDRATVKQPALSASLLHDREDAGPAFEMPLSPVFAIPPDHPARRSLWWAVPAGWALLIPLPNEVLGRRVTMAFTSHLLPQELFGRTSALRHVLELGTLEAAPIGLL